MAKTVVGDDTIKTKTAIPTPLDINLNASSLTIKLSCGDCRHFTRMAFPEYGSVCSKIGIVEEAKPCKRFTPDSRLVEFQSDPDLVQFATFLATVPTSKLGVIASILTREHRTRKQGFNFGEVVYLRVFGDDYISNYRRCRVVQADARYVHVEGKKGFTATVLKTSLLNFKQFKKKRAELEAAKKIRDPKYKNYFAVPDVAAKKAAEILNSLVPPTLDGKVLSSKRKNNILVADATTNKVTKRRARVLYTNKVLDERTAELDTLMRIRG